MFESLKGEEGARVGGGGGGVGERIVTPSLYLDVLKIK
jgi:hypothetical protein